MPWLSVEVISLQWSQVKRSPLNSINGTDSLKVESVIIDFKSNSRGDCLWKVGNTVAVMTHAFTFCTEVFRRLWDPFYLASFTVSYNLVPTSKAREKRPGDEVEVATTSCKNIWLCHLFGLIKKSGLCMILRLRSPFPPSPLGKVSGNTLPCPILGGTTLNGGEEEGKCYNSHTCLYQRLNISMI